MASPIQVSSSWGAFVKSIASFNGDLSSLTAPPFILSGTSLTEFSSYWCQHPPLFAAPASEPDPAKRAVLVLKWFISTLKQQYASRSEEYGNEKKPLNPFLGELFLGEWEDSAGVTELISEQVSHHPPATAYSIRNARSGVHLEGYNAQKATFKSTIIVKQIGHAVLTVPIPNADPSSANKTETFLITLPSLHIEGLLLGTPFVELDGSSYITSSSGFTAKIDYSGRGWLSGKKNSVTAVLYRTDNEKDVLYNVTGVWTKSFDIYKGPSKTNASKTKVDTYDAAADPITPLRIRPVEEQYPLESRRAWAKVAAAILKGDMDTVSVEKGKIEQAQRDLRAKEREEDRAWERRYFTALQGADPILESLGPVVGVPVSGDADKTGGLWRYDNEKAEKVRNLPPLSEEEAQTVAKEILGQ
ncbi:Oxysterol-binding protein [Sodiomyces alkalinus F11]|uniref:Oxysterol-binding protein n=1 Tax=Sodiomyces alkalinus (strain CBS 110278 / VKM F-3762 / F11) TaxID=1314773 RepID=A0A3N2PQW3_SODAK|nr:Oxysterol-binding protein [Sodiomyces alkalinus F11]ROT36746.1 Oxysterol-binding protein [Sodiomyces alkalinus F11]